MTASFLSKRLKGVEVTLIESSDIPTIGVGESTIIKMNYFLHEMGLVERDWMPACNATYKEGIHFQDFYQKGTHFWHPFQQINPEITDQWIHKYYKEGLSVDSYFDYCYSNTVRNRNNRIDLENKINLDKVQNIGYTYHLDAGLFSQHLKSFIALPGGVNHIVDDVVDVNLAEDGSVSGIDTAANGTLTADLYVDCSGFKSMLLGEKLEEPYLDYNDRVPNDRAIAVRLPYQNRDREMNPYTNSTALDAGWVWNIPLWHRIGTGYVYCSQYKSPDEAELELRQHLGEDRVKDLPFHHIKMKIGKYQNTWKKNVAAIGLAAGFVEPLESTGIELAQLGAGTLSLQLKNNCSNRMVAQQLYNAKMQSVYDEIINYIQLHYVLTDREDTDYWRDQKYSSSELPAQVVERLARNATGFGLLEHGEIFDGTAWNSILIGMQMIPQPIALRPVDPSKFAVANKVMEEALRKAKRQAVGHSNGVKNPSHYEFLANTVYKDVPSEGIGAEM
jgi:tryptophan halogenase